ACFVVALVLVSRAFSVSCPEETACVTLGELRRGASLPEALRIYDRNGALMAEVAGPRRRALPRERIPDVLVASFVAVEDRRFWEHGGVDVRGVLRAALRNVRDGEIGEGASTIPMQLVRTLWAESLRDVGPWRRKVIEARTAPRLIEDLGHEQVLTLYLNSIYLGNGLYGVERASHYYFGVGVAELDLAQIATLVGMTRSPEYYDPRDHPERARAVRDLVLPMLVQAGVVDAEEAHAARERDLVLPALEDVEVPERRTFFTAAATRELRRVAPELAGTPGLALHTTLDTAVQARGETALAAQLAAIEAGRYGPFSVEDTLSVLEGAALALDPVTGAVRAWIGGRDFGRSEFDRVDQARRQVGSLVKPFLVAAALDRGYGIVDPVSADTVPIPTAQGPWLPADHVTQTMLPLREALILSSNRAAAHLAAALGMETVGQVIRRAGLEGPVPALPSTAIGAFDASLLEMTGLYAVLGNGGFAVDPYLLERVETPDGEVAWSRPVAPQATRVLARATSFVVLDALRDVVDRGTGAAARWSGYSGPAAGKTGTTNEGRDAWFVGLTPGLAAGVWVGFDRPRAVVEDRGGGALAAPVWGTWMQSLTRLPDVPRTSVAWVPPPGVEYVRYDLRSGEVLDGACSGSAGIDYAEAWVHAGRFERRSCNGGVRGWFERLWHAFDPPERRSIRPMGRRRIGG
ncbi:MAG TPA: transglycosylase domain-containing protein, partial [Longimicrobiales bacterium]|nr:transglycosylase domain-containing protein [Longimicrobiales bacterium]